MLHIFKRRFSVSQRKLAWVLVAVIVLGLFASLAQPAKAERFTNRSLYINSARASDTTFYILSLQYTTPAAIGSLKMMFCDTPFPTLPCNAPPGLDVSGGTLASQVGESGFTITQQTTNSMVLSRFPQFTGPGTSVYRFDNMVNPNGTPKNPPELSGEKTNFYVRLTDYNSMDATGAYIDFGSVASMITSELEFYTQVPPILIFCAAGTINDDECNDLSGDFVDFGELNSNQTFYTKSEFQARTNATNGFAVYLSGKTFTSGIRSIPELTTPTASFTGVGQFGLNLADNTTPDIGADPVGPGTNVVMNPQYATPNQFLFNNGDVLVTSDDVTHVRKFTVSYILNIPADQPPGVYSTTVTYICVGSF
jgi:hypothetical protein